MPLLSIITINLNNRDGLERTIRSIIEQTYTDFEYIVIDGKSMDGSVDVIRKHSDKFSSWISEPDTGIYNAMNKGLRLAKGKYCLFLNSGDILYANDTLSTVFAESLTSDIVYGDMIIEESGQDIRLGQMPEHITLEHMIKDTLWHPVSFIKHDLFDKYGFYREDLKIVSDYDFFLKTMIVNKVSAHHIDLPIVIFALDGISSKQNNVELIKSEREKVQLQYFDKNVIDAIKLKPEVQNEPDYRQVPLFETKKMVSIIIPCYNAAAFLSETLKNVLQQEYDNWECLLIDDGSDDNTKEIAELFMTKDKRFRYYYQKNAGPSVARNYGVLLAKGEYIQFLDSDDMLEKNKFLKQTEILENIKDCDIVYSNSAYFYSGKDGNINQGNSDPNWQRKVSGKGEQIISTLLQGNMMVVHSPLLRKRIFNIAGLWDREIMYNEDWDLWLRCALKDLVFRYDNSPQTKALIRVHPENRSKDLFKMYLNGLKVCSKISKLVKLNKYKRVVKRKIIFHEKFLEKKIKESYSINKNKAIEMNNILYSATKLKRYKRYSWVMGKMPPFIYLLYYNLHYCILTGKYIILHAS